MQDPVTLCTGQTYERGNILKWFSLGHFTCPTTMQELWDDSVTPNKTLSQLCHTWFSQKYVQMKKRSEDVQGSVLEVLDGLKKVKGQARVKSLKELRRFVANHVSARKTVVDKGGVSVLTLNLMQPAKVSLVVDMLNEGSIETKINCTKLIQMLMEEDDFQVEIVSSHSLLVALMRMVRDKRHPSGILPGLLLLKSICSHTQTRSLIVSIGAVGQLVDLLPGFNPECLELALFILEAVSSLKEGKLALSNCSNTIPNTVKVLMRVSESCTQLALSILWSICKLSPEEYSSIAVDVGLAAKLLLVIQSGCDPLLKQRSAELLKLCSLNYTDSIFISKCKLTRTIR
ncbi:U-box domain-containing protein 30-like protein [Tanacetum coccineum]